MILYILRLKDSVSNKHITYIKRKKKKITLKELFLRGLRLLNFPTHDEFLCSYLFLNTENAFLCLRKPGVGGLAGDGAGRKAGAGERLLPFR